MADWLSHCKEGVCSTVLVRSDIHTGKAENYTKQQGSFDAMQNS